MSPKGDVPSGFEQFLYGDQPTLISTLYHIPLDVDMRMNTYFIHADWLINWIID